MTTTHDARHDLSSPFAPAPPHKEMPRIGEMMLARGLITEEQLNIALEHQRATGKLMGEILVEFGALSAIDLASIIAERLGYAFVDLSEETFDSELAALVPEEVARRYSALAFARDGANLVVAMKNPDNVFALDDLRLLTQMSVTAVMAEEQQLRDSLDRAYGHSEIASSAGEAVTDFGDDATDAAGLGDDVDEAPVVRLVQALLEQAQSERASDVHIEPLSDRVAIRFRIDGVLHDVSEVPPSLLRPVVSRIKVLAGIDISRRRVPQDGRFSLSLSGREIDIRVATLPCGNAEAAVLRLLDRSRGVLQFDDLDFGADDRKAYANAFRSPQGWILASGPTGSGKTSTLYATLRELNTREKSIVSVEDPVEYRLDGIKQIQINNRAGLSFSSALRSILRADPDVIFVGEIRDAETAAIAADASITGHLVLSTIHTTHAAAVPLRLIDMGVEPYLVASALTSIVAQRLVRRLCERCAAPDEVDDDVLHRLGCTKEQMEGATLRKPVGCAACQRTGYRGRMAVYEVMSVTDEISRLILAQAGRREIEAAAVAEGMTTLATNALEMSVRGGLPVEELVRVIAAVPSR